LSANKRARFDRWRQKLPGNTRYLAELVAERILPAFEAQGFVWHDKATAGFLYLVRPEPECWPAVQIRFHPQRSPMTLLDVGCLPESCRKWDGRAFVPVPREAAEIVDGPVLFYLRNRKFAPNYFGYRFFSVMPKRRIERDIARLEERLPRLFELFDQKLLLQKQRWPELEDLLVLCNDRSEHFDEG
jgi:hypothetical protein